MSPEEVDARIPILAYRADIAKERLDRMEELLSAQEKTNAQLTEILKNITQDVESHERRLCAMELEPAAKWKEMNKQIRGWAITFAVGLFTTFITLIAVLIKMIQEGTA